MSCLQQPNVAQNVEGTLFCVAEMRCLGFKIGLWLHTGPHGELNCGYSTRVGPRVAEVVT
jgi:hypothetical protein